MNIFNTFILKEFFTSHHYPIEIIRLIIMSTYDPISVITGDSYTIIKKYKEFHVYGKTYHNLENMEDLLSKSLSIGKYFNSYSFIVILSESAKLYVKEYYGDAKLYLENIKSVACGHDYTIALTNHRELYSWGNNTHGQLGFISMITNIRKPEKINIENVSQISCGSQFSACLAGDGRLYTWGSNKAGQLGLGDRNDRNVPNMNLLCCIFLIRCGHNFAMAVNVKGNVYSWGFNVCGCLGLGIGSSRIVESPRIIEGLSKVVNLVCGYEHVIALTTDNQLYAWGSNHTDQLGLDTVVEINKPCKIDFKFNIKTIMCGLYHNIIITNYNEIYGWGSNEVGQLGFEKKATITEPTKLDVKIF